MRILFQEIPERFPSLTLSQVSVEGQKFWKSLKLARLSAEEKKKQEETEAQETKDRLDGMAGFRRVVDVMCDVNKPLVGHNMLLDLCYFYNYFIGSLPDDVQEFKTSLLSKFP